MERRQTPRKSVLMSGAIEFAGSNVNCLVRNMSISGAALDVSGYNGIPELSILSSKRTERAFHVESSGAKVSRLA
jgi:hypothetical protein